MNFPDFCIGNRIHYNSLATSACKYKTNNSMLFVFVMLKWAKKISLLPTARNFLLRPCPQKMRESIFN